MSQKKGNQKKQHPPAKEENPLKYEAAISNFNLFKEVLEFDADTNEVQTANSGWIIIRGDLLRDIFASLRFVLGTSGNTVLVGMGKKVGSNFFRTTLEKGLGPDEVQTILSLLLNQGGWGKTEIEMDLEKKNVVVITQNCVTARNVKTIEPNCHFLRGYFKGFFGKLFNVEMECVETLCIASGGSACKFNVQQRKM
jgi:predicted hydrocarbon binding protein